MANGALGSGGVYFGGLLSLVLTIALALLALWFYRYIKDKPDNKRLLAWGLGLLVATIAFLNLTMFSVGGMMSGRTNGGSMMGNVMKSMMNDPEVRQDMQEMMRGVWNNTNSRGY